MATVFRWLLRIVSGMILLSVLGVIGVYYLASRSLLDYDAAHTVQGIDGEVEIVRDTHSVPHVFGQSDADVFFGLGFAHAQDRLWQMTMLRRTAQGRLSELFGSRTLKIDEMMRRLDLYPLAVQSVAAQDARTLAALEAYSAGVNAWLETVNTEALGRGAPELFLFSNEIAPWQPADSIALVKLMALQLSGQLESEVLRARISLVLPPERVRDILPDVPGEGIASLPEYAALFPTAPRFAASTMDYSPLNPVQPRGFAGASNAWAAAPSRSASGGALLANDPHLGFSAPSIWYLARMELSTGGVIGGTIPGIPVILSGRSAALGWGITTAYVDDQDIFIERLNPENPGEYETPTGFKPFRTRSSIIQIKDAAPKTIALRWTENGPVLTGEHFNLATVTPPGHVAALSWTALSPRDTSIGAALDLMRAQSIEAAIEAGERHIAPAQNLTLVEPGRIAMKTIGAVPRRDVRHQSQGRFPSPGWIATNRWQGRMPYASNPEFLDPEGGILGNTNNKTVNRPFPDHISFTWGDTQRIYRWQRLMQNREVHTRESFIEAQLDTVSFTARALLPLVAKDLWFTGEAAPEGTVEQRRKQALDLLAEWNGEMNEHLPEPLIYAAWMRALQNRLIRDELGPLAAEFRHIDPVFIERVFRDTDGASAWCNVVQSTRVESCTDIARMALDDALIWTQETYGPAIGSLRWGDAHEATHDHQVLGTVPVLSAFVNIRQSTSGGDNTLQRGLTKGSGPDPFLNVHGAGYRGVYDFADPDSSVFIISTGQSGHPLSRHYDDLGELWRRGEYIPMSLDPALARAAAEGVTVLRPAE
ncbi:Acyl-homoserine lactone acylase QuiP precursor [Pseudoruegeria aquimaris]|uniref:Acyl-homoserine lactone acylase QuiP n=1 Tax=Pseudoruegeria aquimaris TaxID=393663 RepID=A0A1Y5RIF7_9RHOB|nr:penicillin acylase family protein [Pseudoruegeria aquimaris]SLN18356.1 Acyl-homoserine lactone acylase QuiP precursor [Pseudoruegeria aquimaris]